jgi:hypothetical protein
MALFKKDHTPQLSIDVNKIIKCASTVYTVVQKAIPIATDLVNHPENIGSDIIAIYGFYGDIKASCAGVFNTTIIENAFKKVMAQNYLTTQPEQNQLKLPSINDIIGCVKSIKPFATDIYNAVVAFQKGDTANAWAALEQATIDGIALGYTCYKVIADLLGSN